MNVKTAFCSYLVLRMYPGGRAREILPCWQRLRKHPLILHAEQEETNSSHLFLSLVFFIRSCYIPNKFEAIFPARLGERTVRIRKVKGSNPSVSTTKRR